MGASAARIRSLQRLRPRRDRLAPARARRPEGPSGYIECDGGSIAVERAGATSDLDISFGKQGLRMTAGCSDEKSSFRLKAAAHEQTFRLSLAKAGECRSLKAWLKRQKPGQSPIPVAAGKAVSHYFGVYDFVCML
jgi:hypothetical protein